MTDPRRGFESDDPHQGHDAHSISEPCIKECSLYGHPDGYLRARGVLQGCERQQKEGCVPWGVFVTVTAMRDHLEREFERLREDYRELLLAIHSVQHEALQEYLNSSEDGKRTIDAARTWVRANRHRTAVDEEQG